MSEKDEANRKQDGDEDDEKPGFLLNLPFGLGWLRGDGHHLEILLPAVRWIVIASTAIYLGIRIIQELRNLDALPN